MVSHDRFGAGFFSNASTPKGSDSNRVPRPSESPAMPGTATLTRTEYQDHARVAVRTEEEQQAAVKERERQEMAARKDARRKSLGK